MKTAIAQKGDKVKVHYVGKLTDGTIFDESTGREPLEFTLGTGQVIEGFDKAVDGLEVGKSVTVTIPCDEAYGPVEESLKFDFKRSSFPKEFELFKGAELVLTDDKDNQLPVTIVDFDDENVKLDANHQLAGKDLVFEITLVEIV